VGAGRVIENAAALHPAPSIGQALETDARQVVAPAGCNAHTAGKVSAEESAIHTVPEACHNTTARAGVRWTAQAVDWAIGMPMRISIRRVMTGCGRAGAGDAVEALPPSPRRRTLRFSSGEFIRSGGWTADVWDETAEAADSDAA
jgi:hypothetical protein